MRRQIRQDGAIPHGGQDGTDWRLHGRDPQSQRSRSAGPGVCRRKKRSHLRLHCEQGCRRKVPGCIAETRGTADFRDPGGQRPGSAPHLAPDSSKIVGKAKFPQYPKDAPQLHDQTPQGYSPLRRGRHASVNRLMTSPRVWFVRSSSNCPLTPPVKTGRRDTIRFKRTPHAFPLLCDRGLLSGPHRLF